MKNIQGNQKDLKLTDKKGRLVYKFKSYGNDKFTEQTYYKKGNELTFKNSEGKTKKRTRTCKGNILSFENEKGFGFTKDENGNLLSIFNK